MDASRFDQLLKAFAGASGRRDALRSLSLAGLALLSTLGVSHEGNAKKKKKGKKKKKCKGVTKKCGKTCIPSTSCCTNADCDGGICEVGTCQCLDGSKSCDGRCIPEERCCDAADCDDANPCTENICNNNGTCSHPKRPDLSDCGGGKACSGGVCATYPACLDIGLPCGAHSQCCGGFCAPTQPIGTCGALSDPGEPCHNSGLCVNSTCVGFVCTQ
jgi:hypothetical protein